MTRPIHQLLPALHPGDAVGNEALALRDRLRRAGFASEIFAAWADPRVLAEVRTLVECRRLLTADSVLLYHFGCGSPAGDLALETPARLVLVYHNITPARFFDAFDPRLARQLRRGRQELASFASRAHLALAKSDFSRNELDEIGFARTAVSPYVLCPELYGGTPSPVVRRLFPSDRANILVVGRIVPNKLIEDVLRSFAVYQRALERRSRLLLVGDGAGAGAYQHALMRLANELGLRDVVFAGHVTQEELLAYYAVADVLVSLSEHEGYGVPLVEAMMLGVPVVAFDAGAVSETLGGGGILLKEKPPELVATVIDALRRDSALREAVLSRQRKAAQRILAEDAPARLLEALAPVLA